MARHSQPCAVETSTASVNRHGTDGLSSFCDGMDVVCSSSRVRGGTSITDGRSRSHCDARLRRRRRTKAADFVASRSI